MAKPNNNEDIDIYELLSRADQVLADREPQGTTPNPDTFEPEFDESMDTDDTVVYRNAANGYGRNFAQPQQSSPARPLSRAEQAASSIRAYNADFRHDRTQNKQHPTNDETAYIPTQPAAQAQVPPPAPEPPKKRKRKSGCLIKLMIPVALILILVLIVNMVFTYPKTDSPLGPRRNGVSTILLCGADEGGYRTDTMMLLYVDKVKQQAGLLTLPRDTYTVTDYGDRNKLNSAYGRNGGGEEGMEVLLDYVEDTIGYRPDGYVLIELPILLDLIDLFGGVEFHVPQDMSSPGINNEHILLSEGLQHLNGEQALALLRFRYGYADQDIGRQNVQKNFIKACLEQWMTLDNMGKLTDALDLFKSQSLTDLETTHFLWFGWNLLRIGFKNIHTDTLPGYPAMIGDVSYYVLYPGEVADMVQDRYNPYQVEITRDMLDIATE